MVASEITEFMNAIAVNIIVTTAVNPLVVIFAAMIILNVWTAPVYV
jgi:hypothetical protein